MNNKSRTKNSFLNIMGNLIYQVLILVISFFTRRVFIKNLGVDYLGISGLFSNLLEIFSLAELGIGTAIVYDMYKYLAEKNEEKLQELICYYKSLYNKIAMIILIFGLITMPLLKYIVNLETSINNIEVYYLFFIFNSVVSYLFAYKTTIIYADQNDYKLKWLGISLELTKCFLQILLLLIFKSYVLFLLIQVSITLIGNIVASKFAEKWYPFIKNKAELPKREKTEIWQNIKSMFFYKIGGPIMNNTDNIIISIIVSTSMVGIYSNYAMIYTKLYGFINIFFISMMASIGNINVTSTNNEKYKTYKILNFISYVFFSIACIGIWFVSDDIVIAISGSNRYLLTKDILFSIVLNFYCMGILNPNVAFRQTTGLFKITKYSMLICCILNILFSIVFGSYWGLFGIIFASALSRIMTNIWYEPFVLYKKFFDKNPLNYFWNEILKVILLLILIIFLTPIINLIKFDNLYINISIKTMVCCIISLAFLWLIFHKTEEYIFLNSKIKMIFNDITKKIKIIIN